MLDWPVLMPGSMLLGDDVLGVCVCDVLLPWDEPAVCETAKLVASASTKTTASACFFITEFLLEAELCLGGNSPATAFDEVDQEGWQTDRSA